MNRGKKRVAGDHQRSYRGSRVAQWKQIPWGMGLARSRPGWSPAWPRPRKKKGREDEPLASGLLQSVKQVTGPSRQSNGKKMGPVPTRITGPAFTRAARKKS